jgi:hypothetical protein
MAISDALFASVQKDNRSNSQTKDLTPGEQETASNFLTVQSLTNFAAMTGALTVAWKALSALSSTTFATQWTPFWMAVIWLFVSLIMTATQQKSGEWLKNLPAWFFIGAVNTFVLFAAVIGIH